jgi:hypothetical protein
MKRFTLKLALIIFAALCLFILYFLACFPLLNTTVFRWVEDKGEPGNGSQISANKNSSDNKNDILTFNFENPVNPEISDYIIVSITAKNTGQAKYPYGSIAVNLSGENIDILSSAASGSKTDDVKNDMALNENSSTDSNTGVNIAGSPEIYHIQERTRIFVDGIRHTYYIPVGENKYWRYDWNLDGPTLKGKINSLEIEIPIIEGVDIQINSIALNKRLVFAADSHINHFFKSYFQLSYVDRYLTPAYVFLILFIVVFFPFRFLLNKKNNIGIKKAGFDAFKISFKTLVLLAPLLLLTFFSFHFINNYIFTVKGYWDSYKQYIIGGRLDETYYGFSDFEKFVSWIGEKVPQDQDIIVLVKGEPVYIMAQMAYGLYPRDIKFIDISRISADETADKILSLNFAGRLSDGSIKSANTEADKSAVVKNNTGLNNIDGARAYEYIVILSGTDKELLESLKVKLEYSYRENAGFLYKLILK